MSTDDPQVAKGARVRGDVEHIDIAGILGALGVGLLIFWWIAVTISTAVLGALLLALVPRGFEAGASVGRDPKRWWIAALVGLGLVIGLPIVGVVAISSLVGLPFGLGLLGALGLVHAVGYVAGAFFLGRLHPEVAEEPLRRLLRRLGHPPSRGAAPRHRHARLGRRGHLRHRHARGRRVPGGSGARGTTSPRARRPPPPSTWRRRRHDGTAPVVRRDRGHAARGPRSGGRRLLGARRDARPGRRAAERPVRAGRGPARRTTTAPSRRSPRPRTARSPACAAASSPRRARRRPCTSTSTAAAWSSASRR